MKIAFVGKGGSGKSTTAALFIDYLTSKKSPVFVVDADINIHLPSLLDIKVEPSKALSLSQNVSEIKDLLKGKNTFINEASTIVKTTPPSFDSGILSFNPSNKLVEKFSTKFSNQGYFFHVGTYMEEGIGDSCYHSDLAIFESLLSHTILQQSEYLIADMVAGTDAFAGSLHAQFDAIFLIVEPTPEGTGVFKQYKELSQAAGVLDYLFVIGNKIDDEEDLAYLNEHIGDKLIGCIHRQAKLKKARQQGKKISSNDIEGLSSVFEKAITLAQKNYKEQDKRLALLHTLHKKHAQADYIIARHGDLSSQIDPSFSYDEAVKRMIG